MTFSPPPASDFTVDVTDEEVAFFREHGYLALDRVTTDEEVDWLREVYDALEARPRTGLPDGVFDVTRPYGSTDDPAIGQLLFPERFVTSVHDTTMWRNARRIAVRLLDLPESAIQSWGHLIFKPPFGIGTAIHQDEAYWDVGLSYHAVGAWVPLDDVDERNGCLWFVPGSHRGDVLRHRHLGDDPAVHLLEITDDPEGTAAAAVPVPLRAGGVSFHHPRTLHLARTNTTARMRRAWATEFQSAPIARETPADHPWVTEGHDALVAAVTARTR